MDTASRSVAAAAAAPMMTLAEGVAQVVEKHLSRIHGKVKDEVAVVPLRHRSLPEHLPELSELPAEISEALSTAVQRETNRSALRSVYTRRMATFRENLSRLDPDVTAALRQMKRAELTITAPNVQVTLRDKQAVAASEGGGGGGSEGGSRSEGGTGAEAAAPLARSKPQLRQGIVYAAAGAIADLGIDPGQEYAEHLAMRLVAHPQLRPLILVKLPEAMAQAAQEHEEAIREGRVVKPGRKRSGAPLPRIKAQIRGDAVRSLRE